MSSGQLNGVACFPTVLDELRSSPCTHDEKDSHEESEQDLEGVVDVRVVVVSATNAGGVAYAAGGDSERTDGGSGSQTITAVADFAPLIGRVDDRVLQVLRLRILV